MEKKTTSRKALLFRLLSRRDNNPLKDSTGVHYFYKGVKCSYLKGGGIECLRVDTDDNNYKQCTSARIEKTISMLNQ